MTLAAYKGRCPHCGHNHDDNALRDFAAPASAAVPAAIPDAVAAMERAKKLPVWDGLPHALHVELDTIFRALAAPSQPADQCPDCHGTGQICTGTSGQAEDGNAPEFERCPTCGYGESQPAEPVAQAAQQPKLSRGPNKTPWRISDDRKELVDCEGNRIARLTSLDIPNAEFIIACVNKPSHPAAEQAAAEGKRGAFDKCEGSYAR